MVVALCILFRNEGLKISESMAQDFGFTLALGKQAHSRLRNCFYSASVVGPKGKPDSDIIEFSFLNIDPHIMMIPSTAPILEIRISD